MVRLLVLIKIRQIKIIVSMKTNLHKNLKQEIFCYSQGCISSKVSIKAENPIVTLYLGLLMLLKIWIKTIIIRFMCIGHMIKNIHQEKCIFKNGTLLNMILIKMANTNMSFIVRNSIHQKIEQILYFNTVITNKLYKLLIIQDFER